MTLEESARRGYEELWTEMLTATNIERKEELIGSLNFLQPLCGPGFLDWAIAHLPFFQRMQSGLTPIEYFAKRQQQILEQLMELLKRHGS